MAEFELAYKLLNAEQKKAVDTIDGPVLVIAGPGTGKTQLLATRAANILKKTDAAPQNLLCLTFTNKAANNMRERLGQLVGPSAHSVQVRTFHSFAADLISSYPEYFWNGAQMVHIPDAVQLELITNILSELPLDNPLALKFAGQFTTVKDVMDGLKLAKEAGLTPAKLKALLQVNIKYIDVIEPLLASIVAVPLNVKKLEDLKAKVDRLPDQATDEITRPLISLSTVLKESLARAILADEGTDKTTHTGNWKKRWVQTISGEKSMFDERKRNAWWTALADVYETYRDRLHQRGFYDYADMIIEVITQLEQKPDMLASVQEQFQYVLIDEFQDTNAAQLRLAHLVSDHYTAQGKPNLMAVGDDDQSIFKFNGAELSNMMGFKRSYPEAEIIVLTQNYRSSQELLDAASKIINQAEERVVNTEPGINKQLRANVEYSKPSVILHVSYQTAEEQYFETAKLVAKAFKTGRSVAILARGNESLKQFSNYLQKLNVPMRYELQQNILKAEPVEQILLVASIVQAIGEGDETKVNENLSLLLSHPLWRIEPKRLWELALENRQESHWLNSLLGSGHESEQALGKWLVWLSQQGKQLPLPRMLEYIIGLSTAEHLTSPIRSYFLETNELDTNYLATLSAVKRLLGLANEFSSHSQSTLQDLVRLSEVANANDTVISDESPYISSIEALDLLTVHKAKGLEFDDVFIIDAVESQWRPSMRGRKPPANLPLKPSGDTLDDYIRLMFVAVTRSKQNLYISSYLNTASGDSMLPAAVIREAMPAVIPDLDGIKEGVAILETAITWPRLEGSDEKLLLSKLLDSYALSASGLLDFLDVIKGGPHYFLEKHLLRLPEAGSTALSFGNAVHKALEHAQHLTNEDHWDKSKVLNKFQTALQEELLPTSEYDRYLIHGQRVLERLFKDYKFRPSQTGKAEVPFREIRLGNAIIGGKLDNVDVIDETVVITDYKTGKPLKSLTTADKSLAVKAWRHRTQLEFYVLLAKGSGRYTENYFTTQMMYVEADNQAALLRTHSPDAVQLTRLTSLIETVWQKIASLDFPDTRHYSQDASGIAKFEQDLIDHKI